MSKKIITHSGDFHTDEVFAVAALIKTLNGPYKVIRTRDEKVIETADFCVDVGGKYDPDTNRFDHHQIGGAGARENDIPYSSFGLVWRKFGQQVSGSKEIADAIDRELVQPIDAVDCGVDIYTLKIPDVGPFGIGHVMTLFRPSTSEKNQSMDGQFEEARLFAGFVLDRLILHKKDEQNAKEYVAKAYAKSTDKRTLILDKSVFWERIVSDLYPEVLFVVYPKKEQDTWGIKAVRKEFESFESRKDFPDSWAGKRGKELAKETGISTATFCHIGRFVCGAETKEDAIKLAGLAVDK